MVLGIVAGIIIINTVFLYTQPSQTGTEITPNDEFFTVPYGENPRIDADRWQLKIRGLVARPLNLTYSNLTQMEQNSAIVRLKCVDGPEGTAKWTGIKLKAVLELSGVLPNATEVIFKGVDGYTSSIAVETRKMPA